MLGLAVLLGAELYRSNRVLGVSSYEVSFANLPKRMDGFTIAHLSDWHNASFGRDSETLIAAVQKQNPDLIALTGDFVEYPSELEPMRVLCAGLAAIAPTYYVAGNHEWAKHMIPRLKPILQDTGVIYLSNDYQYWEPGNDMCVVGIEDLNGPRDMPPMSDVLAGVRRFGDPFILMLCHRYDRIDDYQANKVDLALTGHAHGGMIRLPFTDGLIGPGRELFPRYTSGVSQHGGTTMVTSRGLGNTPGSFRLFNAPELAVITLRKGEA